MKHAPSLVSAPETHRCCAQTAGSSQHRTGTGYACSRIGLTLVVLLIVMLCAGCGSRRLTRVDDAVRHWTIMVYMAADNDLEPQAIRDLNELEVIGSSPQVSVVVQVDRTPGYDTSNDNWTGTRRYYVTRDMDTETINSELIGDMGELDMADPDTLAAFVGWAAGAYPAERYLLVLWNHGRGWMTETTRTMELEREVKAIHIDYTDNNEMTLRDLTEALDQCPPMDVILFDACLMGMVEVAHAIRQSGEVMVASEDNVPDSGQPYDRLLARFNSNPAMSAPEASRAVIDEYVDYYLSRYSGTFTCSAIDLASVNGLVSACDQLAGDMVGNPSEWPSVRTAQQFAQRFDFDKNQYIYYKDLYDFAARLGSLTTNQALLSSCASVESAVDDAVLYERNSGGAVAAAHGLSIYLPPPGAMLGQYRTTDFALDTRWDEFLEAYR